MKKKVFNEMKKKKKVFSNSRRTQPIMTEEVMVAGA